MMACAWKDTKTEGKNLDVIASNVRWPYCCICLVGGISEYRYDKKYLNMEMTNVRLEGLSLFAVQDFEIRYKV